jgi:hypothetical protein
MLAPWALSYIKHQHNFFSCDTFWKKGKEAGPFEKQNVWCREHFTL